MRGDDWPDIIDMLTMDAEARQLIRRIEGRRATIDPQALELGLYPYDRLRSLLRGAHAIERRDCVGHR